MSVAYIYMLKSEKKAACISERGLASVECERDGVKLTCIMNGPLAVFALNARFSRTKLGPKVK